MELVTVKESHYTNDLVVLKSKLESEGIKCFIKDEYTSDVLNHLPNIYAKLQVYKNEIPRVKSIIGNKGIGLLKNKALNCPHCNSLDILVSDRYKDKLAFVIRYTVSQLTMSDYRNIKRNYICSKCDSHFTS